VRRSDGFALIGALWLLVAISAIGLEFGLRARQHRLVAINRLDEAAARQAAEAGLQHARSRLEGALIRSISAQGQFAGVVDDAWGPSSILLPDSVSLLDARYDVRAFDANSCLNLNRADEEMLRSFFRALEVDFGLADRIAQSVVDWRDADDLRRARGAERDDYVRLGSPVLPPNAPFRSLDELRHVQGVTPDILERARPHLTLLGSGRINLNTADRPVLLALPGMQEGSVSVLFRMRREGRTVRHLADLGAELPARALRAYEEEYWNLLPRTVLDTREVEVVSRGTSASGRMTVTAHSLFAKAGDRAIQTWRQIR
jgi:general secretion pathway protein K